MQRARPTVTIEMVHDKWIVTVKEDQKQIFTAEHLSREEAVVALEAFLQDRYLKS